jgi:hypothetical protein
MSDLIKEMVRMNVAEINQHIEELAAAYLKKYNIEPEQAVIVWQRNVDGSSRIWIERK